MFAFSEAYDSPLIRKCCVVQVAVKEEEGILDSSDILAHISGVNSFKYNYTLESWI